MAALGALVDDAPPDEVGRVLKVRGALLTRAIDAARDLVADRATTLPAWRRYSGVVWEHLDPASLTSVERRRLLVPSALYGVTGGEDPVADYRLTMNAALAPLGNLATFWRPQLVPVLGPRFRGRTVVDLLPREHEAALDVAALTGVTWISVHFVTADGSRSVGHDAKAVKGVLAREVLIRGLEALEDFEWFGWRSRLGTHEVEVIAPSVRPRHPAS